MGDTGCHRGRSSVLVCTRSLRMEGMGQCQARRNLKGYGPTALVTKLTEETFRRGGAETRCVGPEVGPAWAMLLVGTRIRRGAVRAEAIPATLHLEFGQCRSFSFESGELELEALVTGSVEVFLAVVGGGVQKRLSWRQFGNV